MRKEMSKVTLGGDRVGSGQREKQNIRNNYERSNHNLSCSRVTSMGPGILYPIYTNFGMTGDTFDIDMSAFMRTLPTEGPMFGAFKLQLDVYTADARLYQAILHNNTVEIGMDMDKVLLPKVEISTACKLIDNKRWKQQMSKSCLMYYLGLAGVGQASGTSIPSSGAVISRKFNALPMLSYYDIFKNYYANKQEENAYVIGNGDYKKITEVTPTITSISVSTNGSDWISIMGSDNMYYPQNINEDDGDGFNYIRIEGSNLTVNQRFMVSPEIVINSEDTPDDMSFNNSNVWIPLRKDSNLIELEYILAKYDTNIYILPPYITSQSTTITEIVKSTAINLKPFTLKNIDTMRKKLLGSWDLDEEFVIDQNYSEYPYKAVVEVNDLQGDEHEGETKNVYPLQGLVVKTYQSDMFNNWLETEWVNKITKRSAVQVQNGSFTMDALNMAKKIYNLYNRIAVSGGSYDDWQLAAYGEESFGKTEKPVYHGGMSSEVVFDEVVSSVASADQPLGTLGGRGNLATRKGGHVVIKCREHCVIMVIASLTPRLTYSQGNAWYLTELDSMDDFHKPEFDQIGFQDLIGERMAWWDTKISPMGVVTQTSYGKQPAWINYQTDVDKCYGDFAEEDGKGFMVLQRLYDQDEDTKMIKDVTTYIDPSKYNYVFAVNDITAQNFWGFFDFDIKARRKMSASQIPNI